MNIVVSLLQFDDRLYIDLRCRVRRLVMYSERCIRLRFCDYKTPYPVVKGAFAFQMCNCF